MSRDNWALLQEKLGKEMFDNVRHDCGRKLDSFRDARQTVKISLEVYDLLPKAELQDAPFNDLPADCTGGIFIAKVNGKDYLVNTEGFSYSRYIAKVKVV